MRFPILILTVFLISCTLNQNGINYEPNIEITPYFCPRDNCTDIMVKTISKAEKSVHCAFYDLDIKDLIVAIAKKSSQVDVKLVIDKNNYEEQIKGPGVKVANSKQYMHNKFCIIDENTVLTGSLNPTANGVNFNNNNIIVLRSNYISQNYENEFDELWNGVYASGDKVKYEKIASDNLEIDNYFCPEDDCKNHVIDTLNKAQENIYFMTYSFTDEEIADVILFKNIETKGIFETLGSGSQYSQYTRLKDFGIDVKKDKNKKNMHHKVFIIDGKTVITGSFNPTGSGNFRNDENVLIIHNGQIADRFLEEFELLWG